MSGIRLLKHFEIYDLSSYCSVYKMSVADEPSGDLSGQQVPEDNVDQSNTVTPTEAQENAAALSKPVYVTARLPQAIVPEVNIPSRKHEVPSSELELETPARRFTIGSEQRDVPLESKTLSLHANPEEEKGTRESRKIHQHRSMKVTGSPSGNSLTKQPLRRRRSLSEGSTPHNSLKKETNSTQQASDDGYISPLVVQQLRERLRQLEGVAKEADEKKKFEGLYISEKQKREEVELRSSKYEREVEKLRNVVYKLDKFGKFAVLTTDEKSLVRSVRAEQGMDNSYIRCFPSDLFNSPLQL